MACSTTSDEKTLVHALIEVPRHMNEALALEPQIELLARDLSKYRDVLYLGRGTSFPIALEGALKLKEISYIHAEGYAAGELKHGPIALIDENMPVIVIAPHDKVFEKTVSNMQEVAARGGRLILMTDADGARAAASQSMVTLKLPTLYPMAPLVHAVPVQLSGLSHRRQHGHRRRSAAQSCEVGHGGIDAAHAAAVVQYTVRRPICLRTLERPER